VLSSKNWLDSHAVDPRTIRFVKPTRVVWQEGVDVSALVQGNAPITVPEMPKGAAFLLDFGRELHGAVRIATGKQSARTQVRVRFGESVSEAMNTPNNDHAIHDHVCDLPLWGTQTVGNTGFRFVRIDFLEPGAKVQLEAVDAVLLYHDIEYVGRFQCSDDRLNRIWDTGAYTVHMCMQDLLWDGIKRDRLAWLGDLHPEVMVVNTVFGHQPLVEQSLDYVRDRTPLPRWMNDITSYSIWWILIQHDWYRFHGRREYLEAQRPYLLGLLDQLRSYVQPDGQEVLPPRRYFDWPSANDTETVDAGLQSLLLIGLEQGAKLCDILGETVEAAACRAAAGRMRGCTPKRPSMKNGVAFMTLAGYLDPSEANREWLAPGGGAGLSAFHGYYVLQARAMAGDYTGCLNAIRDYWGGMLDLGATTFWEHFDMDWIKNAGRIDELPSPDRVDVHASYGEHCYIGYRHSFCHGWAGGPTA